MLQIKNLSITHKKDLREIIKDFSCVLNYGDKAVIIGEEGNGKEDENKKKGEENETDLDITVSTPTVENEPVTSILPPASIPTGEEVEKTTSTPNNS